MPTKECAWLTTRTMSELLAPDSLNSGRLADIYAARRDDFEAPSQLEIECAGADRSAGPGVEGGLGELFRVFT